MSELIWKSAERALDGWGHPWRLLKDSLKLRDAVAMAIAEERERCAKIAAADGATMVGRRIADAIRNAGVTR